MTFPFDMATSHHPLSPSSFPAWAQCPGWDSDPGSDRSGADEGNLQHAALAAVLSGLNDTVFGQLTPEARESVEWAADRVRELARGDEIKVERQVTYTEADNFAPNGKTVRYFGTADVVVVHPPGNMATLVDYKSGSSRDYAAQLAGYSLALFSERQRLKSVNATVIFGRDRTIRSQTFTRESAAAIVLPILASRESHNRQVNACDYCSWCVHRGECPAVIRQVELVANQALPAAIRNPGEIVDPVLMGQVLDIARRIETWSEVVRERGLALARTGSVPSGWRLQHRRGRRSVTDIDAAFALSGVDRETFLQACTVSLPKLVEVFATSTNTPKAQAQADLDTRLADVIEESDATLALVKT